MSITDRLRREWFLTRFGWPMQDYPQRTYRDIKADQRRELESAAAEIGMVAAVRGLGRPAVLAERYRDELDRPVPRWATGAVAAALAIGLIIYLSAAYAAGALDALLATGGGELTAYPFGTETIINATTDEVSVEARPTLVGAAITLGTGLVVFLVGARAWRALP